MKIYGIDHFSIEDVLEIIHNPKLAKLNKKSKEQILKSYTNVQNCSFG
jgi:histidine ammonia-lyase